MSMTKHKAKQILAAEISRSQGIPIAGADDVVDHVQELIYAHNDGDDTYESIGQILTAYRIPASLAWIFD